MSVTTEKILDELTGAIKNIGTSKTAPFDSIATLVRIDDGTGWVHFEGGVDETPVRMTVDAKEGDIVQVRVSGGDAFLIGNSTAPPTDDTAANAAHTVANKAIINSQRAQNAAEEAERDASRAHDAADAAQQSAASAQSAATEANASANNALSQLSIVEDVVGTLNWITQHGEYALTQDAEVIEGKWYFIRSGSGTTEDPYVYTIVTNPESDPSTAGYYELDSVNEAVSNYISAHVALTDAGLWLQADTTGSKVLISPENGVIIYGSSGQVIATYGESATIGDEHGFHVSITGEELGFYEGDTRVAFINNNTLHITQSVVLTEMQLGENKWVWKIDPNDDYIYLKWIG